MKLLMLIFSLIFSSCKNQVECKIDAAFKKNFKDKLQVIKTSMEQEEVYIEPLTEAILYLNAITSIESQINDPHHPIYENKKIMKEDIKKWEKWYEQNKCEMTINKADSLYSNYNRGLTPR